MKCSADVDLFPGVLTEAQFDALAARYCAATGFHLRAVDARGVLRRGRSKCGPCLNDKACRPFCVQAIAEAARWGEPCVLCCTCGRALWAIPVSQNQRICGGLLVAGVELRRPRSAGTLDRKILRACGRLLDLATEHNLINAAQLAERRNYAYREREKAEAIHEIKGRLHDDIRSSYLHEEPALLAAIRRGERTEARRILNRMLTVIYAAGGSHTALLKSFALELIVMMTRAAVQAGGNPESILGLNFQSLTALARVPNEESLATWLCGMLEQLIDAIESNVRRPNTVQLTRAIEFMQEHIAEDLTREDVARAAGLSSSHFSHLMRAKTGWSFTEMITRLRVDHACHLLSHTALGLVEIAHGCGFADQSYFSRVFRRRVGLSPGGFRRSRLPLAPKS